MLKTAKLAGFLAAHAVWSVSDGETLVPILGFESVPGERQMQRLLADEFQEAVARGQRWLAENPESAARAVLIFDAYVELEDGNSDALVVEARAYRPKKVSFTMVLPYRPSDQQGGFAVHRPKLLEIDGWNGSVDDLIQAFFDGVDMHEEGAAVWSAHLDESR